MSKKFIILAGVVLAMAFSTSCSNECQDDDMISIGDALTYDQCMKEAAAEKGCISLGIWNEYDNALHIGEPCEEEYNLRNSSR